MSNDKTMRFTGKLYVYQDEHEEVEKLYLKTRFNFFEIKLHKEKMDLMKVIPGYSWKDVEIIGYTTFDIDGKRILILENISVIRPLTNSSKVRKVKEGIVYSLQAFNLRPQNTFSIAA